MAISQSATNPIIMSSAGDVITRDLIIRKLVWSGAVTAGDDLKVVNGDSSLVVWETKGVANENAVLDFQNWPRGYKFSGIKVTTLDSGKLYIWQ